MHKIILVGYMAVGKSTIGKILAEKKEIKWIDLDKLIAEKEKLTVAEIFKQKGEIYFRKAEHRELKNLLESNESLVISTGGGTPCYANNHLLLKGNGVVSFYLSASIGVLFDRLRKDKDERPLVAGQSVAELKEFIAKNLFDRSYFYHQATYKIDTSDKTPEAIAIEILEFLN